MDRVDATLAGGSRALAIMDQLDNMSDAELQAEADRMAAVLRANRCMPTTAAPESDRAWLHEMFAEYSDEELIALVDEKRRDIAERDAKLGIVAKNRYLGRGTL